MMRYALFARFEVRPGKEENVQLLLQQALTLANDEIGTPVWFALQLSPQEFCVFDAFATAAARTTHLDGPIAQALLAHAAELFVRPPEIEHLVVLGAKHQAAHS